MTTSANVLTNLGSGPFVTRSMLNKIIIITGERTYPRILTPGFKGYKLGLHDEDWTRTALHASGAETYFVQVIPICQNLTDNAGDPLKGTPTAISGMGVTFYFDPFPDDYYCTGYEVWAGTASNTLYRQGELKGRFNTTFEVGETWPLVTTGSTVEVQTIGPPPFAHTHEVYQLEGDTNSRLIMGGGKKYIDGFAKVSNTTGVPSLTGGTSAEDDYTVWEAKTDASIRIRTSWLWGDCYREWVDIIGIDFSGDANMSDVASTLQTAVRAAINPSLICGTAPEKTVAIWQAITYGSMQIYIDQAKYKITGMDFSGDSTLADMASTIQTALRTATSGSETVEYDSTAERFLFKNASTMPSVDDITNGTFETDTDWTKGTGWTIENGKAVFYWGGSAANIKQAIDNVRNKTVHAFVELSDVVLSGSAFIRFVFLDAALAVIDSRKIREITSSDGIVSVIFEIPDTHDIAWFGVSVESGSDGVRCKIDNISLYEMGNPPSISYAEKHEDGTGTDISSMIDGQVSGTDVILYKYGKPASLETVTWDTDHFIFSGAIKGYFSQLSFIESAKADVGTDISGSTYLDCQESSGTATYTAGQTAKRSVLGTGVSWGDWSVGMDFRVKDEGNLHLISRIIDDDHLYIASDYSGNATDGYKEYVLRPYSDQFYATEEGNPFYFSTGKIVPVPTDNSDNIKAIRQNGKYLTILMDGHVWIVTGEDLTYPILLPGEYGTINTACCVLYPNGLAVFTGKDLVHMLGSQISTLDPEKRVKHLIERRSTNAPEPHGIYVTTEDTEYCIWYFGIDSSFVCDTAIVYEVKTGNLWPYSIGSAKCSGVLRDANDKKLYVSGSTYDEDHNANAFTFLHDDDYKNDGASQDTSLTKQGLINTVGSPTTIAGYLTCAALNSAIGVFQSVTDGYFIITIDDNKYNVGPCDFSGAADFDGVASTLQTAVRAQTSGIETVVYDTDHFLITSGTSTNRSNVSYMRPYYASTSTTDISGKDYCNGRSDFATKTGAQNKITLTLDDFDGNAANLYETNDGESGIYIVVCDTNLDNMQKGLVITNATSTVTVTPNFETKPVAGWYWFLAGIAPRWKKWMDFGSPQHKNHVSAVAVTTDPSDFADNNRLALHTYQNLVETVRVKKLETLDSNSDTVNVMKPKDRPATQHGFELVRPNSEQDLKIQNITVSHAQYQ